MAIHIDQINNYALKQQKNPFQHFREHTSSLARSPFHKQQMKI